MDRAEMILEVDDALAAIEATRGTLDLGRCRAALRRLRAALNSPVSGVAWTWDAERERERCRQIALTAEVEMGDFETKGRCAFAVKNMSRVSETVARLIADPNYTPRGFEVKPVSDD